MSVLNNGHQFNTGEFFSSRNQYATPPVDAEWPVCDPRTDGPSHPLDADIATPFELDDLRIEPSQLVDPGINNKSRIRIQKPNRCRFVRATASEEFSLGMALIMLGDPEVEYVLSSRLLRHPEIASTAKIVMMTLAVDQYDSPFLWPVPIAANANPWLQSHINAAAMARDAWVRMYPDQCQQRYGVQTALGSIRKPIWPRETFADLLMEACGDRIIRDVNHPLIQSQLFGN